MTLLIIYLVIGALLGFAVYKHMGLLKIGRGEALFYSVVIALTWLLIAVVALVIGAVLLYIKHGDKEIEKEFGSNDVDQEATTVRNPNTPE